jgi:hypothetical protein
MRLMRRSSLHWAVWPKAIVGGILVTLIGAAPAWAQRSVRMSCSGSIRVAARRLIGYFRSSPTR